MSHEGRSSKAVHDAVMRAPGGGARRSGLPYRGPTDDAGARGSGIVNSLGCADLLMAVEADPGTPIDLERLDVQAIGRLRSPIDRLDAPRGPMAWAPPAQGVPGG